ncbi:MAG: hypothetical protein WCK14_13650 [Actinomycetota bacterium]
MRVVAISYVAAVMLITALATADPNHLRPVLFIAALVICLPAMAPALPIFYVAAAAMWNVTDAANGGLLWPMTAAFTLLLGATACGNVWLVTRLVRIVRKR